MQKIKASEVKHDSNFVIQSESQIGTNEFLASFSNDYDASSFLCLLREKFDDCVFNLYEVVKDMPKKKAKKRRIKK